MQKIGIIVAMPEEIKEILIHLGNLEREENLFGVQFSYYKLDNKEIILAVGGIGIINASVTTTLLLQKGVEMIINCGLVGGLDDDLSRNEVVICKDIVHSDVDYVLLDNVALGRYPDNETVELICDKKLISYVDKLTNGSVRKVRIASADKFVASYEGKKFLVDTFNAQICDMESAAIKRVADKMRVPALFIKLISDSADEGANDDFYKCKYCSIDGYKELIKGVIENL